MMTRSTRYRIFRVYVCFYDMKIDGEPILETLYREYRQESITDYMEWAYEYCRMNFYPIFRDDEFYFGKLQVLSMMEQ